MLMLSGWVKVTIPNDRHLISEKENKCFNVDIEINDLPHKYIEPYNAGEGDENVSLLTLI